jgi:hypothetical protein
MAPPAPGSFEPILRHPPMPQRVAPDSNSVAPPGTWPELFELFHRQWGAHARCDGYTPSDRRRWGRLLEGLELRAQASGWSRPVPGDPWFTPTPGPK